MADNIYTLYGVGINTTLLGAISSQRFDTDARTNVEALSGHYLPGFAAIVERTVKVPFTTRQIARALSACGIGGFDCFTGNGLKLYAWKMVEGGARSASTDNLIYTYARGLLVPTRLTMQHGQDATLDYECTVISADGETSPVAYTTSSVPSGLLDDQRYSLGSVTLGGTVLQQSQIQSVSVDFGIRLRSESGGGLIYPTFACIEFVQPKITIETTQLGARTIDVVSGTHANTEIQCRKRQSGGTFASSGHIVISAAGLIYNSNPMNIQSPGAGRLTLMDEAIYDGTNAIVKFT